MVLKIQRYSKIKIKNKFEIENVRYYFHIFISKIVKLIGKIFFLKNNFVFYKIYVGNFLQH